MNRSFSPRQQQGSVLLIALVMLLALTLLTLSNMRGVSLESRITANRVEASRLQNLADAALREGEFRFYGPAFLREKLEPELANCKKSNTLNRHGNNKPCLLAEIPNEEMLAEYFSKPLTFFSTENSYTKKYAHTTGAATESAANDAIVAWMPYRGLDTKKEFKSTNDTGRSYWHSYRVISGSAENETVNPEYGAALEGKGTFFFLINGQVDDQIAIQSTIAAIYTGLNN